MVGLAEALKGDATRALGSCEGRPAAQEVTTEHRLLLLQPLQDVREGVVEGPGQAIGETHVIADQAPAGFEQMNGKEPEALLGAQRRHARPLLKFQAHGTRWTVEARAQAVDPRVDRLLCGWCEALFFTLRSQ